MSRCLELAALGLGHTAPNPMVGSAVVHNDRIIGEGYHHKNGDAHAEVNAINAVSDPSLLVESTVYVNLEPCAHHGKTPPCADLIIDKKISRVVVCNSDPYKEVAGKGLQRMREAGIEVIEGVLHDQGRALNRRFFTFHEQKRPYIILKWAETRDGFLDYYRTTNSDQPPLKITDSAANRLVHKWRTEESAILVGRNTASLDNPKLTARHWPGASPLRLVIDPQLHLSKDLHLFTDGKPTWVFNGLKSYCEGEVCYERIEDPSNIPLEIAKHLFQNDIQSLIVEGGRNTIERFYEAGLWDEARIFSNAMRIGSGVPAPSIQGTPVEQKRIGDDMLQIYRRT